METRLEINKGLHSVPSAETVHALGASLINLDGTLTGDPDAIAQYAIAREAARRAN